MAELHDDGSPKDTGLNVADATAGAVKQRRSPFSRILFSLRRYWLQDVIGTVNQAEVIEKRRAECDLSERYLFMTAMSGGIAVLGLLLSSPAVVIGAMLLSPLMDPIMGLGFALAIGDYNWLRQSAKSLAWGTIMAIGLTALVVFLSPIQTITPEIAARTQPNLFDLFVALFSALAGAYAMIRGRDGTIVGVAIATALMPPLATVGFGLATWNWTVFSGALLLYVTNLITIALTAGAMARADGFSTSLTARQSTFQNLAVFSVFIALAVPLAFSLQQIAFQANAQRIVRSEIVEKFPTDAILDQLNIEFGMEPLGVAAKVLTPEDRPEIEAELERALEGRLGRPVELTLSQLRFDTSAAAAQRAQLSAVRAERLDGANLAAYRALEQRIAGTEPEWAIELLPPLSDLPSVIGFEVATSEEESEPTFVPTEQGQAALDVIAWASGRLNVPIVIAGPEGEAGAAQAILAERGIEVSTRFENGDLRAEWSQ